MTLSHGAIKQILKLCLDICIFKIVVNIALVNNEKDRADEREKRVRVTSMQKKAATYEATHETKQHEKYKIQKTKKVFVKCLFDQQNVCLVCTFMRRLRLFPLMNG